jgi:hypothetical protein
MNTTEQPTPEVQVGTRGTYGVGTDKYPMEVVRRTNKTLFYVTLRKDENGEWQKPEPPYREGGRKAFWNEKKQAWVPVGGWSYLSFRGEPTFYQDPSF